VGCQTPLIISILYKGVARRCEVHPWWTPSGWSWGIRRHPSPADSCCHGTEAGFQRVEMGPSNAEMESRFTKYLLRLEYATSSNTTTLIKKPKTLELFPEENGEERNNHCRSS